MRNYPSTIGEYKKFLCCFNIGQCVVGRGEFPTVPPSQLQIQPSGRERRRVLQGKRGGHEGGPSLDGGTGDDRWRPSLAATTDTPQVLVPGEGGGERRGEKEKEREGEGEGEREMIDGDLHLLLQQIHHKFWCQMREKEGDGGRERGERMNK